MRSCIGAVSVERHTVRNALRKMEPSRSSVYAYPSKWSFKEIKETCTPTFLVEFSTFVHLGVARRETGEVGLSLPLGS